MRPKRSRVPIVENQGAQKLEVKNFSSDYFCHKTQSKNLRTSRKSHENLGDAESYYGAHIRCNVIKGMRVVVNYHKRKHFQKNAQQLEGKLTRPPF